MGSLRQLTPQDVMFIGGETPTVYQHTAGLTFLDSSDRPDFGYEAFRKHLEERVRRVPHFRWKLHEVLLGLDLPYWVEDKDFSFDHHIRRIAVPSPGDREALGEVVSYLYCSHMDRNRPLWETWFIEGLADGKYALFQKLHHCMMDGEAASKLSEVMCDFEPDGLPQRVHPSIARARPGPAPEPWRQALNAAWRLSGLPMQASREILDAVLTRVWGRLGLGKASREAPTVPVMSFNTAISSERGLLFGSLPLADVKTVKRHFDVTVNDVVLALVGSSLRNYLRVQRELPDESLRASIAVSLRTERDEDFSNRVTDASVTLATHLADPMRRLRAISRESVKVKREARAGAKGLLEIIEMLPPVLVNAMMRLAPPDQIASFMGVNLLVSNVRGNPRPMYIGGARIVSTHPMSIITPGSGINVTCISNAENIDFGITFDPEVLPDPWLIIDGLRDALAEYLALTLQPPRPKKKVVRKSRAKVPRPKRKSPR